MLFLRVCTWTEKQLRAGKSTTQLCSVSYCVIERYLCPTDLTCFRVYFNAVFFFVGSEDTFWWMLKKILRKECRAFSLSWSWMCHNPRKKNCEQRHYTTIIVKILCCVIERKSPGRGTDIAPIEYPQRLSRDGICLCAVMAAGLSSLQNRWFPIKTILIMSLCIIMLCSNNVRIRNFRLTFWKRCK